MIFIDDLVHQLMKKFMDYELIYAFYILQLDDQLKRSVYMLAFNHKGL